MSSVCKALAVALRSCVRRASARRAARARARRRCASAPIPNNMPFSNAQRAGLREQDRRAGRARARPAARLLLVAAAPRLHPQHAERRTLRRGDRRAGAVRPAADDAAVLPIVLRLRLAARSSPADAIVRRSAAEDADDRHPDHRRRLQQPAGGAGAGGAAHRRQRARLHRLRRLLDSPIRSAMSSTRSPTDASTSAVVWGPLAGYYGRARAGARWTSSPVAPRARRPGAGVRVRHRDGRAARGSRRCATRSTR